MKSNTIKFMLIVFIMGFMLIETLKHNIDLETINRQSNQINYRKTNMYDDKSNFDSNINQKNRDLIKLKEVLKVLKLDRLEENIETNNKSIFDYSFSSMLKSFKILEKLNEYNVRSICRSFSLSSLSRLTSYINY